MTECGLGTSCSSVGSGTLTRTFVAPASNWYFLVVDGRTAPLAFDDSGSFSLRVELTCAVGGCGC